MTGGQLLLIGVLMVLSVPVLMFKDGVRSDEDMIQWLLNRPLEFIFQLRFLVFFGTGLMGFAAALYALTMMRG